MEPTLSFWLSGPATVFYIIIMCFGAAGYLLWQINKTCKTHCRLYIRRKDGRGDFKLAVIENGFAVLKKDEDGKRKIYGMTSGVTDIVQYPGGMLPGIFQRSIRQLVVEEGNSEPVCKFDSAQVISDEGIANMDSDRTTAQMNESNVQLEIMDKENAKLRKRSINPTFVYALIMMAIAASVYAIYLLLPLAEALIEIKAFIE